MVEIPWNIMILYSKNPFPEEAFTSVIFKVLGLYINFLPPFFFACGGLKTIPQKSPASC